MNDDTTSTVNPYAAPSGDLSGQTVTHNWVLAGRWTRFFAVCIDAILLSFLTVLPLLIFLGGWTNYTALVSSGYLWKIGITICGFLIYLAVNGVFLARDGQSIGKKALGIKIVRSDGRQADFTRIVSRRLAPVYSIQLIPFLGGLLGLVDVLCIFRDSRQCMHDQIADTIVVNANKKGFQRATDKSQNSFRSDINHVPVISVLTEITG